jgi:hypothetical protein
MKFKPTLTPALSHPMGEGEPFAVSSNNPALGLLNDRWRITKLPIAVPSPVGRERVRVRVGFG